MKTISARQFRLGFQELTEPVVVNRRERSGTFTVIGTWTPAVFVSINGHPQIADPINRAIAAVEDRGGFGHPSPAPKPGRKP